MQDAPADAQLDHGWLACFAPPPEPSVSPRLRPQLPPTPPLPPPSAADAVSGGGESQRNELLELFVGQKAAEVPQVELDRFKDKWIARQLSKRWTEFTTFRRATIQCSTWNVCGAPFTDDLTPWLCAPVPLRSSRTSESVELADIVAVGFQELDLRADSVVFNNTQVDEVRGAAEGAMG